MNTKLSLSIFILLLYGTMQSKAQASYNVVQDVILLNNKPYLVQMTKAGDILAFKNDIKDSYSSIGKQKPQQMTVENVVIPGKNGRILSAMLPNSSNTPASIQMEIEEDASVEGTIASNSEPMIAKGGSSTNYDYDFAFDHRDASLSFSSVNQLNQMADLLLKDKKSNAYIKSYFFESIDISKILSKNRTNAIKDVLILRGIDGSRINIDQVNNKDWANNRVKVSIH